MNKAFDNFTWVDDPNHATPLSAENLNKINTALNTVDNRVVTLDTDKADKDTDAVSGNVAKFDSNGNPIDSGISSSKIIVIADNSGFHNSVYRGKSLGTSVTADQYTAISNGTFEDMFIGDYWTINGIVYRIAHFDYYINKGDTRCTTHHVTLVPDSNLYNAQMNTTDTASGGYVGSAMYTANLASAKSTINTAFSGHVLSHREFLTNAITSGYPSAGSWYDSTVELMNEINVYGCPIFTAENSLGATIPANYTIDNTQFNLFAFAPERISNWANWWLRDVCSSPFFAYVGGYGVAYSDFASYSLGVRPRFSIIG